MGPGRKKSSFKGPKGHSKVSGSNSGCGKKPPETEVAVM